MSITCEVCNREFKKQITNSHLKTHKMTTMNYKEKYGQNSLSSTEYKNEISQRLSGENNPNWGNKHTEEAKQKMSQKRKGKPAHNKGKKLLEHEKLNLREGIKRREEKYNSGELIRANIGKELSNEEKEKISKGVKEYAINNPHELQARAQKSLETKKNNGYDLAFFRGKTHTEESKKKILISTYETRRKNKIKSLSSLMEFANKEGFEIISMEDDSHWNVKCPNCDELINLTSQYFYPSKYRGPRCINCDNNYSYVSKAEAEIYNFVKSLSKTMVKQSNRSILGNREIDIYIPEKKLAIEYCGLYWHSDNFKDKKYHLDKLERCLEQNIKLLTIFEDEWFNNPNIIKSILSNHFGLSTKVYARKCQIKEVNSKHANEFLKENHLQGSGRSNIRYGLYYNDELISLMTFSSSNISRKISGWEINRFCSKINHNIVGGANKLFSHFIKTVDPEKVISYADRRWSEGNVYLNLGFELDSYSPVNYWYWKPNDNTRYHRFSLRKNKNDDQNLTEFENRQNQGWNRIWDCGHSKYIWKKAGE